ncbi:MAG TPA: YggT family protein [Thermoanaerobaculia bacterium]|nr:YggT family protein [Thermoanaerobaculia bacterium]
MNRVGGAFFYSTLSVIDIILSVLEFLIIAWVILSWILFFASRSSVKWRYRGFFGTLEMIAQFFERALSPLLAPFRRLLPAWKTGGIDWSPLLLLLLIYFLRMFLRLAFY